MLEGHAGCRGHCSVIRIPRQVTGDTATSHVCMCVCVCVCVISNWHGQD